MNRCGGVYIPEDAMVKENTSQLNLDEEKPKMNKGIPLFSTPIENIMLLMNTIRFKN